MKYKLPSNPNEYLQCVQTLAGLADAEFVRAEQSDMHNLLSRLPGLVSIVNVIGYLRGQDGFFIDVRPEGLAESQRDLYALEDEFEKRLSALLTKVADSYNVAELHQRMDAYYVTARTPRASSE